MRDEQCSEQTKDNSRVETEKTRDKKDESSLQKFGINWTTELLWRGNPHRIHKGMNEKEKLKANAITKWCFWGILCQAFHSTTALLQLFLPVVKASTNNGTIFFIIFSSKRKVSANFLNKKAFIFPLDFLYIYTNYLPWFSLGIKFEFMMNQLQELKEWILKRKIELKIKLFKTISETFLQ